MSHGCSSSKSTCSCGSRHCNRYAQEKKRDSKQEQKGKVYYACGCKGGNCSCYYRKEGHTTWRPVTPHNQQASSTYKHWNQHYTCKCYGSRCRCGRTEERSEPKPAAVWKHPTGHVHSHSGQGHSHHGWYRDCGCFGNFCHCPKPKSHAKKVTGHSSGKDNWVLRDLLLM